MKMYIELYAALMKYLPPGQVCFELLIGNDAQQKAFFERFHQYFHKGGG